MNKNNSRKNQIKSSLANKSENIKTKYSSKSLEKIKLNQNFNNNKFQNRQKLREHNENINSIKSYNTNCNNIHKSKNKSNSRSDPDKKVKKNKIFPSINTEKIFLAFVNIIIPHVKLLVTDLNGSHIIYKLILTKNKKVKIIEDIICMQVKDIAITRKGCSFLKKYFDFENENDLIKIKQCILQNLREIITDQYGNYVIQSILTKEGSPIVKDFINEISKNIIVYSNNKFASNAVEKCFENESMKNTVLDKFLQKDIFEKIILDKFGNYVVQKAIAKADNERKNYMLQLLIPLVPSLKTQYFGQRLLSKLILQYPDLNIN